MKIISIFLLVLCLLTVSAAALADSAQEVPSEAKPEILSQEYYQELRSVCQQKESVGCCMASYKRIEARKTRALAEGESCAAGERRSMLKCPDSFRWCEPDPNAPKPAEAKE